MNREAHAALYLAVTAHEGQKRADGQPFVTHPIAVAAYVDDLYGRGDLMAAAYLHDVVEDTTWTTDDLLAVGFRWRTVDLVDRLTRRDRQTYQEYIERIAGDADAAIIKRCDIQHNLENVDDFKPGLRKRYERALVTLDPFNTTT